MFSVVPCVPFRAYCKICPAAPTLESICPQLQATWPHVTINLSANDPSFEYYGPEQNGRLKRQYDALNRFVEFAYDNNGNVTRVTDDQGRATDTQYDALNRPVRIVGPVYSDSGLLINVRPVTRYVYDNLGNPIETWAGHRRMI